jgi:hypothetical protein
MQPCAHGQLPQCACLAAYPQRPLAAVLVSAVVTIYLLVNPASASQCGPVVFRQDFDKYQGTYQKWSHEAALEDFQIPGPSRPSGSGIQLAPGLGFGLGFENCDVGEGKMRLKFPKGENHIFQTRSW